MIEVTVRSRVTEALLSTWSAVYPRNDPLGIDQAYGWAIGLVHELKQIYPGKLVAIRFACSKKVGWFIKHSATGRTQSIFLRRSDHLELTDEQFDAKAVTLMMDPQGWATSAWKTPIVEILE